MPINASYEYLNAEKEYLNAQTLDEKIKCLQEMIRTAPKHKGSENLLAELKTRLKKLLEKKEKTKKIGKTKTGIRKEGYQCVLLGMPNVGKSSLLSKLTNARPKITPYAFSTTEPEIGTMHYSGIKAQIVDLPPVGSEFFDIGIVNTADCILEIVDNLDQIAELEKLLKKTIGKKIVVVNKIDLLNNEEKRKLEAKIQSKRINGVLISCENGEGIEQLKEKILKSTDMIRVYTKEPGKPKSNDPIVLKKNSTVKDVAESIFKGFSDKIKETRLTGPSGKFPNQRVGLNHVLSDLDTVEFHTK